MTDLRPVVPNNWGAFGAEDEIGTLNYLTSAAILGGVRAVVSGERHPLNLPIDLPRSPTGERPMFKPTGQVFTRRSFRRNLKTPHGFVMNDDEIALSTQGSSQWDALVHIGLEEEGVDGVFYNGFGAEVVDESGRASRLGIDKMARIGIVGRGVLLDLARMIAGGSDEPLPLDHRCTVEETLSCIQHQGVELRPGDIMCLRTGWTERYLAADDEQRRAMGLLTDGTFQAAPGITPDHAAFAHASKWAAVTADNPGIEELPTIRGDESAHVRMLRNLGMPFGELFHFASLSEAAASDSRWDFLFVAVPMWIPGGAGSPANAIAIR